MKLQTWIRTFIAISFTVSGLVEMLGATGLVVELSPDRSWGSGTHTLAISGPLQLIGAAVLLSGRKTRLALIILGCYAFLACVFGNLPQIFNSDVGSSAFAALVGNLAVLGGVVYWLHAERIPGAWQEQPSISFVNPGRAALLRLVLCLAMLGGVMYWLRSERMPSVHGANPVVPVTNHALALPVKLLA